MVGPELEDQAFPFQRGLAFAEGFFHLVVPLEVEVNEVAVGAAIDSPAHDPDLILSLDEIAVLTERDVRRSTQPQILVVEVRATIPRARYR